jgi:hypothetical protein
MYVHSSNNPSKPLTYGPPNPQHSENCDIARTVASKAFALRHDQQSIRNTFGLLYISVVPSDDRQIVKGTVHIRRNNYFLSFCHPSSCRLLRLSTSKPSQDRRRRGSLRQMRESNGCIDFHYRCRTQPCQSVAFLSMRFASNSRLC